MRTITALFVGLGSIGTRHLKNLTNLCADRGWTLQADALRSDLSRPLRDGVAALLHAQYTDLADAPAHYDMVFITNPTSLHADALTRVRGRGGALFIEKTIFSAEQTGLDFLGIDLLFGREKPYFCEINVMPGLEGIEKASGINVAGKIIETIQSDFTSKT